MPVEIGKVLEAAVITDLRDAIIAFHQEPAGMADTDLRDIIWKGLPGMMLEIPGEGGDAHI